MDHPVETIRQSGYTIKVYTDDFRENPLQEFDTPVHVALFGRYSDLGNDQSFDTPDDFMAYLKEQDDELVVLPVYLYDHSGLSVSTGAFSCPWDSGQAGWAWISLSEMSREFGTMDRDKADEIIRHHVALLDDYLTGNVYGYVIEDQFGAVVDSLWGFYGNPNASGLHANAMAAVRHYAGQDATCRAVDL